MQGNLKILGGTANPALVDSICLHLGCTRTPALLDTFSDGEIRVEIRDNVRGDDVFVVQPTCSPVNFNLVQLCLMLDALKRASAGRVTAVLPYYGYARQDRKVSPRAPISAKLVADCLIAAGMHRLITVDLHAGQLQGFFNVPVDNLYAAPVIIDYLRTLGNTEDIVIVSPDAGGVERARAYAKRINAGLAIIDKRRDQPNQASAMHLIGSVEGKRAILVDDMIDTAGTIVAGADVLIKHGAREVMACATHPVLSGPALERLEKSSFSQIIVTDTVPLRDEAKACGKIKVLSVAGLIAKAIYSTHTESSVSVLFV